MIYKAFQIKLVYKLRLEGFDYMTAYMFASANQVYSALESIQVSSSLNSYFFSAIFHSLIHTIDAYLGRNIGYQ